MKDIIQIKNISFNYPDQPLLFDKLSMDVHEGEWTAIIGQNGSGKSTLARLIDGLIVLKSGQIVVDGLTVNDENIFEIRNKIGMVFQNPEDQFVGATVEDDVAFGLENRQVPREEMHRIVEKKACARLACGNFETEFLPIYQVDRNNESPLPALLLSAPRSSFWMRQPVCSIRVVVRKFSVLLMR